MRNLNKIALAFIAATCSLLLTTPSGAQPHYYGSQLMTPQQWARHRATIWSLPPGAREAYRAQHHAEMKKRATARSLSLPHRPPSAGMWNTAIPSVPILTVFRSSSRFCTWANIGTTFRVIKTRRPSTVGMRTKKSSASRGLVRMAITRLPRSIRINTRIRVCPLSPVFLLDAIRFCFIINYSPQSAGLAAISTNLVSLVGQKPVTLDVILKVRTLPTTWQLVISESLSIYSATI